MRYAGTAATVALLLSGCANYGWASRPGEARTDRAVFVRTVDVDAYGGADAARLTRDFVSELQQAGVPNAAWSGSDDGGAVACDVAFAGEAFGERAMSRATARCFVDDVLVTTRDATAQLALAPEDRTLGRRRAAETAARRSLTLAAHDVAGHLLASADDQ